MKIVILAGGSGKRLWPLSRSQFPKQFLNLGDELSLLQVTLKRNLALVSPEDLFIVTSADFFHEVQAQVVSVDARLKENIIVEPIAKNTAPAIALVAMFLKEKRKVKDDEVIFIFPSDHYIPEGDLFAKAVKEGEAQAHLGKMVTFGVKPTGPKTGYGYLKMAGSKVEAFIEKPTLEKAEEYIKKGNYLWNAGCFGFSLATIEKVIFETCPEIALKGSFEEFLARFPQLPSISFDYAVMEKAKEIVAIPLNLKWSDLGAWDQVFEVFSKDKNGNALLGNVVAHETKNSLLFSQKRLLVSVGVEDLVVIETEDAILILKKSEAQKVKDVVQDLDTSGHVEVHEKKTTHRPWGAYTILEEGCRYKIKRIEVKPKSKLSLQLHYHRSEHWIVVTGTAKVTINGKESLVHEGESIFVPKSAIHRMENPGKVALEIIEVQVGEYLGEDDIVRLEDIYGRLKADEAFQILLEGVGAEKK